jgi:hypothetical protein
MSAAAYPAAANILPFFPADVMAEYDGIFAAGAAAADAEIARLTADWAERAAECDRTWAEAEARSAEVVRRRREYETAVIFLVYPKQVRRTRSKGRVYTYAHYVNLGPRLNWGYTDEAEKYVDSAPAPAGAYYRTAAELWLDNAVAARHYEDKTYLAEFCDARNSSACRASDNVTVTERAWARTLGTQYRRAHALAAFAAAQ